MTASVDIVPDVSGKGKRLEPLIGRSSQIGRDSSPAVGFPFFHGDGFRKHSISSLNRDVSCLRDRRFFLFPTQNQPGRVRIQSSATFRPWQIQTRRLFEPLPSIGLKPSRRVRPHLPNYRGQGSGRSSRYPREAPSIRG